MLKKNRALKILAAVQTRAQNEVTIEERPGFPEKCKEIFVHLGSAGRWRAPFDGSSNGLWLAGKTVLWLPLFRRFATRPFVFGGPPKTTREPPAHGRVNCALPGSGILPGRIICGLIGLSCSGNYLDFHIRSSRQRGNLHGGTGRRIFFEIRAVCFVYHLKIAEVGEEDGCLNDVIKSQTFHS